MNRYRNLRKNQVIRNLVSETIVSSYNLIVPLFVVDGKSIKQQIKFMPNYFRFSIDQLKYEVESLYKIGLKSFLLFTSIEDHLKNELCTEAFNDKGLMAQAIKSIKNISDETCVITDVALDPFSSHGHDGLVKGDEILNDETVDALVKMSLMHASVGADFVAPSDMMDFRIMKIRSALEKNNFTKTGILSYSAKYASSYYGPFRDALHSVPCFGDKKTYQMDFRNRIEAIKEVKKDIEEGADIVMIKPAGAYLDIIRDIKNRINVPVAAYQVSGEYSMIKAASEKKWINEELAIVETLTAIKRSGADIIATYFAKDYMNIIKKDEYK